MASTKKATTKVKPKKLSVKALGDFKAGTTASSAGTPTVGHDDSGANDYVLTLTPGDTANAKIAPTSR